MFRHFLLLFVSSLYVTLVYADYTIDDSDYSTLQFSENPAGPVWGPFGSDTGEVLQIGLPNGTMQTVDATQCFDGTYTYAACSTSNNCAVQFSFNGSGLTIYVLQAGPQGMSASLSIDSGTATTETLDAPLPPQYYVPGVVLFSVQNIQSGTHTAMMTVLDWDGGFSGMMLDYIDVNQTLVITAGPNTAPSSSSSPSPSPSPSPSSTQNSTPTQSPSLTASSSTPPADTTAQITSVQVSSAGAQTYTELAETVTVGSVVSVTSVPSLLPQSSGVTTPPLSTSSGNGVTATSTGSSPSTSKQTNVAAAVGGGVGGGVGLLALIGLIFFCLRRRRRLRYEQTLNDRPTPLFSPQLEATFSSIDPPSVNPFESSAALSVNQPSGTSRPLPSWPGMEAGNLSAQEWSNSSPISHTRAASSGNVSDTLSMPVSIRAADTATPQDQDAFPPTPLAQPAVRSISYPNEKSHPFLGISRRDRTGSMDVSGTRPALTDEQADFVNSLFTNNVPAPVVARVLERMIANPQGTSVIDPEWRAHLDSSSRSVPSQIPTPVGITQWVSTMSEVRDGETAMDTAPPSYDYARAL